ncbi:MAG: DUF2169 domain-containing protein [Polyangiaceae bacterium]|nr:DUF2169 domain-containing protein [Polyangiaceae bacterium]
MNTVASPEIHLDDVYNGTPFEHFVCDKMGVGRQYFDTLVVKGTFTLKKGARAELAPEQRPIVFADEPWNLDDPERSALRVAGEVLLTKPNTDVIVSGHAHAPSGEPQTDWSTSVEVRGKELEVEAGAHAVGPNAWRYSVREGWNLSDPEPVTKVPIRYDLAFGGAYQAWEAEEDGALGWRVWADNPSGIGFFDTEHMDGEQAYAAPQWLPEAAWFGRTRDVPLAGYGPIARPWPSRLRHAGTYDDQWLKEARRSIERGIPADYARDFDPRFFQCAHPSLIMPRYLVGDEVIRLTGLMPGEPTFTFQLPCIALEAKLRDAGGTEQVQLLCLDTVNIDTDAATVSLCWRLSVAQQRKIGRASITLKEVS